MSTAAREMGTVWPSSPAVVERWVVAAVVALFSAGVALDVPLALYVGSSSLVLGAPLALVAAWRLVRSGRVRGAPRSVVLLTALTAWTAVSIAWATDQDAFVKRLGTAAQLLASLWLAWQLVRSERDVRALLLGFLTGCWVLVVAVWRAYLRGEAIFEGESRFSALGLDLNDMSVTIALGIPLAVYFAVSSEGVRSYVALLFLPAAGSAIALSGSRGGALAAAAAVLPSIAWLGRRSLGTLALVVLLLGGAGAAGTSLLPRSNWERILSVREQIVRGSMGDRVQIWRAGLDVLTSHPVIGVGAGGFPAAVAPALGAKVVAHSTMLSVAVELGGVGLLLFGAAIWAVTREVGGAERDRRALGLVLILTWVVGSASLTWELRKATWLVFLACAALGAVRDPHAREAGR